MVYNIPPILNQNELNSQTDIFPSTNTASDDDYVESQLRIARTITPTFLGNLLKSLEDAGRTKPGVVLRRGIFYTYVSIIRDSLISLDVNAQDTTAFFGTNNVVAAGNVDQALESINSVLFSNVSTLGTKLELVGFPNTSSNSLKYIQLYLLSIHPTDTQSDIAYIFNNGTAINNVSFFTISRNIITPVAGLQGYSLDFNALTNAAIFEAATCGGKAALNSHVLAVLNAYLVRYLLPANIPPKLPSAFENVPI